jgi:hypothetical protein
MQNKFIGTWNLESVVIKQGNTLMYPFGKDVKGMIFYGEKYMSVQIMMPIESLTDQRKQQLKLKDLAHTLKTIGYMGYFGTYEIDEANQRIIHKVQGSITQNVGEEEIRTYRFEDNKLILSKGDLELTWTIAD